MKTDPRKKNTLGIAGLIALIAAWAAILVGYIIEPPPWIAYVWLVTMVVVLPCVVVAGVFAARKASKWWYVLAGAGFLSEAFLLAIASV